MATKKVSITTFLGLIILLLLAPTVNADYVTTSLPNPLSTSTLPAFIDKISNFILAIIMAAIILSLIYAAFLFLTSAGNLGQIGQARKIVFYSLMGFLIALAAKAIIYAIKATLRSQ